MSAVRLSPLAGSRRTFTVTGRPVGGVSASGMVAVSEPPAAMVGTVSSTVSGAGPPVTDTAEIAERGDLPGILRVALREGRVVDERPGCYGWA